MKKVETKALRTYNAIIALILTLLGFNTACNEIEPRTEYGSPSAQFKVNGTIESELSQTPIVGLQAAMKVRFKNENGEMIEYGTDSTLTQTDGTFGLIDYNGFPEDRSFRISISDIDEDLNGSYNNYDTIIEFVDPQFKDGDGNWYAGEVSKQLNIKLKPKN